MDNLNLALNEVDFENGDEELENNFQVVCEPIVCPLTPLDLSILKRTIKPLTKMTHDHELTSWPHAALKIVLDLGEPIVKLKLIDNRQTNRVDSRQTNRYNRQ